MAKGLPWRQSTKNSRSIAFLNSNRHPLKQIRGWPRILSNLGSNLLDELQAFLSPDSYGFYRNWNKYVSVLLITVLRLLPPILKLDLGWGSWFRQRFHKAGPPGLMLAMLQWSQSFVLKKSLSSVPWDLSASNLSYSKVQSNLSIRDTSGGPQTVP